jgi:hypothetical protein
MRWGVSAIGSGTLEHDGEGPHGRQSQAAECSSGQGWRVVQDDGTSWALGPCVNSEARQALRHRTGLGGVDWLAWATPDF